LRTQGKGNYRAPHTLSTLEARVRQACQCARLVGKEQSKFSEVEPVVDEVTATLEKDFREISLSEKKSVIEEYNKIILAHHDKIETSNVGYSDSFRKLWYANSEGTYFQPRPLNDNNCLC